MSEQPISNQSVAQSPAAVEEQIAAPVSARWWMLPTIGGAILALDQAAKTLVATRLQVGESWEIIPAIASVIKITYSHNSGAAFGMLPQASDLFMLLAVITVGVFIASYPKLPSHATLSRVSIGLISGGALSNALDRLRFNYVVDFVHVQIPPYISNISNFADHAITVGVILLLIDQWRAERRLLAEEKIAQASADAPEDAILTTPATTDKL